MSYSQFIIKIVHNSSEKGLITPNQREPLQKSLYWAQGSEPTRETAKKPDNLDQFEISLNAVEIREILVV